MLSSLKTLLVMGQDKIRELRVEETCVSEIKDDGRWRRDRRGVFILEDDLERKLSSRKQIIEWSFVPRNFLLLSTVNDETIARNSNSCYQMKRE